MSAIEFTPEQLEAAVCRPYFSRVTPDLPTAHEDAMKVASAWGLTVEDLLGRARHPLVCEARAALYARLRERGWSYPQIGKFVGRDHTTVMAALGATKGSR